MDKNAKLLLRVIEADKNARLLLRVIEADKNGKLLLRVTEAAELLSVSRSKCYQMVSRREIPSLRLGGGGVRIPAEALRRFIESSVEGKAIVSDRPR